jgi:hypothetical protein
LVESVWKRAVAKSNLRIPSKPTCPAKGDCASCNPLRPVAPSTREGWSLFDILMNQHLSFKLHSTIAAIRTVSASRAVNAIEACRGSAYPCPSLRNDYHAQEQLLLQLSVDHMNGILRLLQFHRSTIDRTLTTRAINLVQYASSSHLFNLNYGTEPSPKPTTDFGTSLPRTQIHQKTFYRSVRDVKPE